MKIKCAQADLQYACLVLRYDSTTFKIYHVECAVRTARPTHSAFSTAVHQQHPYIITGRSST